MLKNSLLKFDQSKNVSWLPKDLEVYDNQYEGLNLLKMLFTFARCFTLVIAIIVHRAFYRFMKRLQDRPINQMIYPHMVRLVKNHFVKD